ncbi:MAG: tRNA (guanosine(46)-N7)-methyltransferase TrmB [Lachnospiraceae bacterium]|jgi:tRNA (guanine-N7-)-methyltransferase|nr:tRNA (guanosine(46)-N7)-methyltransferase TrmB [Lachnospiraceae bacterium]
MRLRNIPGAEEHIRSCPFVVTEPTAAKGRWNEHFGNSHPLAVEIGSGKGHFITTLAAREPGTNYVGMEKYSSVLLRAVQKQEERLLPNLALVRWDAQLIEDVFAPGEVSRIYLNFSDPWPKPKQASRRLCAKEFLRLYAGVLTDGGIVEFKTDQRPLFDFGMSEIEAGGFTLLSYTYDLHADAAMNAGNIMTEYEEKFSAKGNKICKYIIKKA